MSKIELTDTHCHNYLEENSEKLAEMMLRAEQEGVSRIYMPALDRHHHGRLQDVEKRYPGRCFAMVGIHPCYIGEDFRLELDEVERQLGQRRFAAMGEIGLDYYWSREFDKFQMTAFVEQIGLAAAHRLPIVIHSRNAMDDTIKVLQEQKGRLLPGIFHCFSGTLENAKDIIDCGMMLGIGGVVTYKNAGLAEVVAELDLEHIVLETDAPYLAPVPFRGKKNESSYLKYILKKVAEIKQVSEADVAAITTANALKVFGDYR